MDRAFVKTTLFNVISNVAKIIILSSLMFAVTGLLFRELNPAVFGLVPLFASLNKYLSLVSLVVTASVARFVSLEFFKGNIGRANDYYCAAFYSLIFLCIFAIVPLYIAGRNLEYFFDIPDGYDFSARMFFWLSCASIFLGFFITVFNVPSFIRSRFYLIDGINIISRLFQFFFLATFVGSVSLVTYGFSLIGVSLISVLLCYVLSRKLVPELGISHGRFSVDRVADMSSLGGNSLVNSLGVLLYASSDIILCNVYFGSEMSGYYGIAVQCGLVIAMLGGGFTNALAPTVVGYIASQDDRGLVFFLVRMTKILSLLVIIPAVLFWIICDAILNFWLGGHVSGLALLASAVVGNQVMHQCTGFTFVYCHASNNLRVPALMTLATGVLNIIFSILLIKTTDLGVYAIALGTFISIFIKTVLFNTMYCAYLLNEKAMSIWVSVWKGLWVPVFYFMLAINLFPLEDTSSIQDLIISIVYYISPLLILVFAFQLDIEERRFISRFLGFPRILARLGVR